jgi:threonyl-tRNA synthetase
MKILLLHSDFMEWEPKKKALKSAKEEKKKPVKVNEALVVFTSVEKGDEQNPQQVIENTSKEILKVFREVKAKSIVIYPYVHLSTEPSSPDVAIRVLEGIAKALKKGRKVHSAPFGWYKAFNIKVKGHPLSELSRSISAEKPKRVSKERKEGSEFHRFLAIDKDGNEYPLDPKGWRKSPIWKKKGEDYERLRQFVKNELDKSSKERGKPKHIEYMRKLELVDYCPESDVGHFKWFPKGILIKDLILAFQENLARNYGAFKIQNPLIYKTLNKSVRALIGEFQEKDYRFREGNEELVLRFASDPGAFPYMQKVQFSYRNLPVKEYEEAICFRKEQSGELSGLRRVRNFIMTDLHSFCGDMKQTKEEYSKLCFICQDLMNNVISKGRWVMGWEIVEAFYRKHRDWVRTLIKDLGVPSFIKMMPERSHYYSLKNEYQSIEADGANSQISTVQLDVVNGERFRITYKGKDNKDHPCIIIHCSTFGSVERTLCSILENAAIDEKEGKNPMLPLWLSPTQIRLLPMNDSLVEYCEELAERFSHEEIRVDIDDRVESISKKVRDAEMEWIPYSIVIGEKEKTSGEFPLRPRKDGKVRKAFFDEIVREIKSQTDSLPFKPLPLDRRVTKRPIFFG